MGDERRQLKACHPQRPEPLRTERDEGESCERGQIDEQDANFGARLGQTRLHGQKNGAYRRHDADQRHDPFIGAAAQKGVGAHGKKNEEIGLGAQH